MNQESDNVGYNPSDIYDVPITDIIVDTENIDQDTEIVEKLKESILRDHTIRPIILILSADDQLYLAVGKNRFRACLELKVKNIPSRIISGDIDDIKILKIIFGEDITPLKRAIAMQVYIDKYQISRKDFSKIVDLKVNSISEILSLNKLPEEIKKVIINSNSFSLHSLREIARIKNSEKQLLKFNSLKDKIDKKYINNPNVSLADLETDLNNQPVGPLAVNIFDKKFDNDTIKQYFQKITSEIKRLRNMYAKFELKKVKYEINELNEELKALRYKISDSICIDD